MTKIPKIDIFIPFKIEPTNYSLKFHPKMALQIKFHCLLKINYSLLN